VSSDILWDQCCWSRNQKA